MKIFHENPNKTLKIIEQTDETANEYGLACGFDLINLTEEHIAALREGKMLAWNDGEYSTFVRLKEDK